MKELLQFLQQHRTSDALIAFYLFSNAIDALPAPQGTTGFYKWFYGFSHGLAGNLFSMFRSKLPQAGGTQ